MTTPEQNSHLLGEMHGLVKAMRDDLARHEAKLDTIDSRVRHTESTAARTSMATSGVLSVGIALLIETLKGAFHRQG